LISQSENSTALLEEGVDMRSRSHCAGASKKNLSMTLGMDCPNLRTFGGAEGYFYGGEIAVDPEAEQQKEQFGLLVADDDMWEAPSLPSNA
jgi:hypothetical protein